MNYEFESIEDIIGQIEKLPLAKKDTSKPDPVLQNEAKRLGKIITKHLMELSSETQIQTYLQVNLHKLVDFSDRLFNPEANHNPNAQIILNLIEEIRRPFANYIPENLKLPLLFARNESEKINQKWSKLKLKLDEIGNDPFLTDIMETPIKRFHRSPNKINWTDYQYLKSYVAVLERTTQELPETEWAIVDVLIGLGFNHSRFTAYHARMIKDLINEKPVAEKQKVLQDAKIRVCQAESFTNLRFERHKMSVVDEICKWIDIELNNNRDGTLKPGPNQMKLTTKLKAVELAFWQKLQYDFGIYDEITLESFSEKIAFNFKTVAQDELSAPSLKSKFYTKEQSVIDLIEKTLAEMLLEVRKFKS